MARGACVVSSIVLNSKGDVTSFLFATNLKVDGFGVLSAYTVTGIFFAAISSIIITPLSLRKSSICFETSFCISIHSTILYFSMATKF